MIAVIDYEAGNLTSVRIAFDAIGCPARITRRPADILSADRVVFPGVGAAGAAMTSLSGLGLVRVIRDAVAAGTPFLGICLGTQIILQRSEEDGGVDGIGLLAGTVKRFRPADGREKVPHMGWNQVTLTAAHPLFDGIASGSEFYFVHSYYPAPAQPECVLGTTEYGGVVFASVLGRANIVATQFHPEKSGRLGLRLLANFSRWNGAAATSTPAPDITTTGVPGCRPGSIPA